MKFDLYLWNDNNDNLKDIEDFFSNNFDFNKTFFIHNQENLQSSELDCTIFVEKIRNLRFEIFFYFHQSMILTNFLEKNEYSIINHDFNFIKDLQNIDMKNINIDENVIITQNLIIAKTKILQFCLLKTLNMFWDQNYITDKTKYIQYIFKSSGYNIVNL